MSDSEETPKLTTTSWIYKLNKEQLVEELNKRGIQFDEKDLFENFRKTLVAAVKAENVAVTLEDNASAKQESKQQQTEPLSTSNDEETFYSVSDSDEDSDMSGNKSLEFCLQQDDWEIFVERLEIRIKSKKIADDGKAGELLERLGDDAFKLMKNLCAPVKMIDKTYEELVDIMTKHLKPKPSELMERCTFNQAKQMPSESVAEFAARLKMLALNCGFSDLQVSLRDQFAVGMRDEETRISLFKMEKLTFENALKEAIAREAAVKNASSAVNTLDKRNTQRDVFTLKQENKSASANNNRKPPGKQRFGASKKYGNQQRPQNQNKPSIVCYCCGGQNHVRSECRYKDKTCNHCGGKGHLERACLKKNGATRKTVNKLDESSEIAEEEEEEREPHHFSDFFNIKTDNERTYKSACVGNECARAEPMYVDVVVNGKNVCMEIDSGTYATVVSEAEKNRYFHDEKLVKTDARLNTYDKRVLHPLGKLNDLKVEFNGKTRSLDCLVLSGKGPMLIGRQWLEAFGCWPLVIRKDGMLNSSDNFDKDVDYDDVNKNNVDNNVNFREVKPPDLGKDEPGMNYEKKMKINLNDNKLELNAKLNVELNDDKSELITSSDVLEMDNSHVNFFKSGLNIFDNKMLAHESKNDKTLCNVIKYTLNGWPVENKITENEKLYFSKRFKFSVEKNCLFLGLRAVVPKKMQPQMLKKLHATQIGITRIKMLAKLYVWWPGLERDIEIFSGKFKNKVANAGKFVKKKSSSTFIEKNCKNSAFKQVSQTVAKNKKDQNFCKSTVPKFNKRGKIVKCMSM